MLPDERSNAARVHELLTRLDHPMPRVTPADVIARARGRRVAAWRRAAAILVGSLLAVTGGVYAAPLSVLPSWIVQLRERVALGDDAPSVTESVPSDDPGALPLPGVALDRDESVLIEVERGPGVDGDGRGWVRVSLTASERIEVRSSSRSTVFTSEPSRLVVSHPSPDTLEVTVPPGSERVELLVDGRIRWSMVAGTVRADSTDADDGARSAGRAAPDAGPGAGRAVGATWLYAVRAPGR